MRKQYSKEKKQEVITARKQGATLKEISFRTGVSITTIKKWLSDSVQQGVAGIRIRQYFSVDEQKMILEEYEKTRSIKAICSKYKIHKSSLLRWKSNNVTVATSQCGTVYTAAQLYNMQRELETLRQENEIIRVCHCSATASTEERVKEVQRLKDRFTVYALCQALNLSRAIFYRVSLRQKNKSRYEENDDALKIVIEEEFIDSGERFGASMIKVKLNERGFRVSKSHTQRLMRELNLICKQNRARCFNSTHRKYKYRRNRLQRNFTQDSPNKFWVSDITYARVNDEFYAICVIIDLFSRKVLAYGIAPEMKTSLVKSTFLKAFESRNQPVGLTFHSDQGTQYTAFEFRKLLRELGVRQSLSNPGTPHDNAVAEAFFSILKREELSHNWYNTPEDLENTLQEYIDFFNRKRPHRKLELQTPDQFEENYMAGLASNC